jgi:hypothetical protein
MNATRRLLASAATLLLAGCAGPQLTAQAAAGRADELVRQTPIRRPVVLDWWKELNDPQLNRWSRPRWPTTPTCAQPPPQGRRAWCARPPRASDRDGGCRPATHPHRRCFATTRHARRPFRPAHQTLIDAGTSCPGRSTCSAGSRRACVSRAGGAEPVGATRHGSGDGSCVVRAWSDLAETRAQLVLVRQRRICSRMSRAGWNRRGLSAVRARPGRGGASGCAALAAEREGLATAERNALRRLATLTGRPAPTACGCLDRSRPVPCRCPPMSARAHRR